MADERNSANLGEELIRQDIITREDFARAREREKESGIPWYRQMLQLKMIPFGVMEDVLRYEFHPFGKTTKEEHQSLGRALVEVGAITEAQLNDALAEQKRNGRLLGNILMDRGWITPRAKALALSKQYGMEFGELDKNPSQRQALEAVPESIALKHRMVPIRLEGEKIVVLVTEPNTKNGLKDVGTLLGKRIEPMLTTSNDIHRDISGRYDALKQASAQAAPPAKATAKGKEKPAETPKSRNRSPRLREKPLRRLPP